jgi:hypothetical protein
MPQIVTWISCMSLLPLLLLASILRTSCACHHSSLTLRNQVQQYEKPGRLLRLPQDHQPLLIAPEAGCTKPQPRGIHVNKTWAVLSSAGCRYKVDTLSSLRTSSITAIRHSMRDPSAFGTLSSSLQASRSHGTAVTGVLRS